MTDTPDHVTPDPGLSQDIEHKLQAAVNAPFFVLNAADPFAYLLVALWVYVHGRMGVMPEPITQSADEQARRMKEWGRTHNVRVDLSREVWLRLLREVVGPEPLVAEPQPVTEKPSTLQ